MTRLICGALLCSTAFAQSLGMAVGTALVQEHGVVAVTVNNVGTKPITAWSWSLEAVYPDGSTQQHTGTVELPEAFLPGRTFTFHDQVTGDPTAATCALTMAVYADNTASGDHNQIRRFSAARHNRISQLIAEMTDITKAMSSPDPQGALASAFQARISANHGGQIIQQIRMLYKQGASRDVIDRGVELLRSHVMAQAARDRDLVEVRP